MVCTLKIIFHLYTNWTCRVNVKKKKPPKIFKLHLLSLKVQSFTSIHVLQIMMTKTFNPCYMVYICLQALATVKERDRDILQREALIRALHREREQALATLKKHGLPVNKNINVSLHNHPKEKSYILILYIFTLNSPSVLLIGLLSLICTGVSDN